MRPVLVLALIAAVAAAGCSAPGVNDEQYADWLPRAPAEAEATEFVAAMREHARDRPPVDGETAYARFLENATRWAADGIDDLDRARNASEDAPGRATALAALAALADAPRGSDREVLAGPFVQSALAERHGLTAEETDLARAATDLLAAAERAVADANASVHAARGRVAGRDALLRAEATLGLASVQLATARGYGADQPAAVAFAAIEARVTAASSRFWVEEAARVPGPAWTPPGGLEAGAEARLDDARAAAERPRGGDPDAAAAAADLAFGVRLVREMRALGLPEGAWAAAQGLRENVRVLDLGLSDAPPNATQVEAAWREAAANVRTYRDAQRFDRAHAAATGESPSGLDIVRAYAALELMRTISEERERVLAR